MGVTFEVVSLAQASSDAIIASGKRRKGEGRIGGPRSKVRSSAEPTSLPIVPRAREPIRIGGKWTTSRSTTRGDAECFATSRVSLRRGDGTCVASGVVMRSIISLLALVLLAGCTASSESDSSTKPDGEVKAPLSGSIDGEAFEPVDVIFVEGRRLDDASNMEEDVVRILASNKPGLCERIVQGTLRVGNGERVFNLTIASADREKLVGSHEAIASVIRGEKGCLDDAPDFVSKGNASLAIAKSDAVLEGSVSSTKIDGVTVEGRFTAKKCAAATNGQAICNP